MEKALVFSVEEFSVFNGPGIRTSVFLKGCPLKCEWCHNPEGQSFENMVLRAGGGCLECGACIKNAETMSDKVIFSEKSIAACPKNLLRYCATSYTSDELVDKIARNAKILNASGGGVTFSGGEPTAQPSFLLECLTKLRGITKRAVQTCGYCGEDVFSRIISECDLVLFDIKLIDSDLHKKYTGVSNEIILKNFKSLVKSGVDFIIRIPLIPTVTDTEYNICAICELLSEAGVSYVELLPYSKLTGAKYPLIGIEYSPSFDGNVPPSPRLEIFDKYGIKAKVM